LQIKSIRISNILSFEEKDRIEDAEEICLEDDINILIGPNGSGKSNFLEILNQIFRNVLVYGTAFNPANVDNFNQNPAQNRLTNTISQNIRNYALPKNNCAKTETKRIKISIALSDNDIQNLLFIANNVHDFNRLLRTYCNSYDQFPEGVTESELNQRRLISFTFEDSTNRRIFEQKVDTQNSADQFKLLYLRQFEFVQHLISLANKLEKKNWPPLKNTFAIISGYRNYNKIEQVFAIDANESGRLTEIASKMIGDTMLESRSEEPIVFSYVKHKLVYAYHNIREDIAEGRRPLSSGKDALDYLSELPIFENINALLREHLGLQIRIHKQIPNSLNYNFNFVDLKTSRTVQVAELSAGQKGIIHFIFSIYGYDLERGVMVVDEPELHLHPQVQQKYLKIINEVKNKMQIQFVIATHSASFITPQTIEGTLRFYRDGDFTRVVSPAIQHDEKDLIRILTLTNGSKIFFASKVVLVEGDSDEYFFKAYFEHYKKIRSLPDEPIEFLYIGGKGNFTQFRTFLEKFNIPTYFIGDLDGVLDPELGFIDQSTKGQLCRDFENFRSSLAACQSGGVKFLDYLQQNRVSDWQDITKRIPGKYKDRIFILSQGDLEFYIGNPIGNKLENAIDFHKNRLNLWYIDQSKQALIAELDSIFTQILA
jgi:putative ATP-dependent endonuclease of the OLD family